MLHFNNLLKLKPHEGYGGREVLKHVTYHIHARKSEDRMELTSDRLLHPSLDMLSRPPKDYLGDFMKEITYMFKMAGWTFVNEEESVSCKEARKGYEYLYFDLEDNLIAGNIATDMIEPIKSGFSYARSFVCDGMDNDGDAIVVTGEEDAINLYHEKYDCIIDDLICENAATGRRSIFIWRKMLIDAVCSWIKMSLVFDNTDEDNIKSSQVVYKYVGDNIARLIKTGWLRTKDEGLYLRTANKTEQRKLKLA